MNKWLKITIVGVVIALTITSFIACTPQAQDKEIEPQARGYTGGERFTDHYTGGRGRTGGLWVNEQGKRASDNNAYRANLDDINRYRYDLNDGERFERQARANLNNGSERDQRIRGGGFIRGGTGNRMQAAQKNQRVDTPPRYNQNKVEAIRSRVLTVEGVDDAAVLVHNNLVLVGIQGRQINDSAKYQIQNLLQGKVRGEHVYVTADKWLYQRIKGIEGRLESGENPQRAGQEIGSILNEFGYIQNRPVDRTPIRISERDALPGSR